MFDEVLEGTFQNYEHGQLESPVHERLSEKEILQCRLAKNASPFRYLSSSVIKERSQRYEKRLLAPSCMSVRPHGITHLQWADCIKFRVRDLY